MVEFNPNRKPLSDLKNLKEIKTAERVVNGKQMIETCKNADGQVVKISVFMDRSGNGKFEPNEAVSVKYIDALSRSVNTTEYRDTDGDGYCDEVVTSDWSGYETVKKENHDDLHGMNHRMDIKYGFKWDATAPVYVKEPLK